MKKKKLLVENFIGDLEKLEQNDDRATLAALRRGLGKEAGTAWECYPFVMRLNPPAYAERAFFIVASLFSLHSKASWHNDQQQTNFGASLSILKNKNAESDSVERRFVALLNADREDLPTHLRHAVSLLKTNEIMLVDWATLLNDLIYWNDENRRVQRRWSRAFWGAEIIANDSTSEDSTSENSASKNQN